ncbi:MAG TPA: methylated-DNA--[protein]-cysteine S-methyltransferase [Bryobacteraceae bacterium]|jgi:methylated-DNA-[protein]-cysteine S-methyltransferase
MNYCVLDSPIGPLLIAGDQEGLRSIQFPNQGKTAKPEQGWIESDSGAAAEAAAQLRQYFAGRRSEFDLPLAPEGTQFQLAVWRELQKIPFGQTISYGELARRIGKPKASRAVGSANGANQIPIVIPCHRVIAAGGKLGGFGGGLPVKEALLALEAASAGNWSVAGR